MQESRQIEEKGVAASNGAFLGEHDAAERPLYLLGLAVSAAILLVIALPMMQGLTYTFDDLGNFHLPMRAFYAQCLASHQSFDWMPNVYCGFYLQGDGQVGMYHPLHRLLYGYLPLVHAFNIELFLSYPMMLAGLFVLLRRLGLRRDSSIFGAMLFTFSGFNLLHFVHMQAIATIAHIPWLLVAIDVSVRGTSRSKVALANMAIALLTASEVLLGYPQYVWMSALLEGLFVLYLWPNLRGAGTLVMLAAAKLLGVCAGAAQLLPTYETLGLSERSDPNLYPNYMLSLPPLNLVQLVGPYLFKGRTLGDTVYNSTHEYGIYDGAAPLMLLVVLALGFKRLSAGRRRLAAWALFLAIAAVSLALGKYGAIYVLVSKMPLVGIFRGPTRYILLFHFGIAVGAALAFECIRDAVRRREALVGKRAWWLMAFPAAGVIAVALTGWPLGEAPWWAVLSKNAETRGALLLAGPALLALGAVVVIAALRGARYAFAAIVIFAAVEQAAYGLSYITTRRPQTIAALVDSSAVNREGFKTPGADATAAEAARPGDTPPFFRIDSNWTVDDLPTMKGYHQTSGYVGLMPRRVLEYGKPEARRLASTRWRWMMAKTYWRDASGNKIPEKYWYEEISDPMPRARMVAKAVVAEDARLALRGLDIATTAVVPEALALEEGEPGKASITRDLPGDIAVTTEAPSRQLLVVSESYHSGWRASIDGGAAEVVPAYGDFIGVAVDRGRHEVALEFRPESLRIGIIISAAGAGLICVLFAVSLAVPWKDRKRETLA